MSRTPLAVASIFVLALIASSAHADDPPVRKGQGRFAFEETVLSNGLRVLSLEDRSTPIVAVQLWYHVGSKDEQADRQGFAHMFEHMMFRGTDRLGPKDHFEFIRRTGGDANAYTGFDQTVYVQQVPSNQLDMVLWLEAERMAGLRIDEGGFATERKVVEEERRLGLNRPYGRVFEQVLEAVFTRHPYRWSPIGEIEHLRASTAEDIQRFWDTYYVPNNATLVVVGDVSHADVRRLAGRRFGWIPRCPDPPRVAVDEPVAPGLRRLTITEESGPAPVGGLVFRTVPAGHPDAVALALAMDILGDGESSRVYLELVRRKQVAEWSASGAIFLEQAGLALVGGLASPFGGDPDQIVAALWEEIEKLAVRGVSEDELGKARALAERRSVTESLTVERKASALGQAAVIEGDAQNVNTALQRVRDVSVEDVRRVVRKYLVRERAVEVTIAPSLKGLVSTVLSAAANTSDMADDEDDAAPDDGARATARGPKAAAERPEDFGKWPPVAPPLAVSIDLGGVSTVLENGLTLTVVENHEVPFVSMNLRLLAGAAADPPDAPGTASLATTLITRGTFARGAEALAAELERDAIELSADADHDSASVRVSCVSTRADRAMRLLAEVVQVPAFDEDEFRILREQVATGMAVSERSPATRADRAFARELWGQHPYGRPAEGTTDDLERLHADGLREWWEASARPESATLFVAGDIAADDALQLATRYFGDWYAPADAVIRPVAGTQAPGALRIALVDQPDAVQSEIRVGHRGILRKHRLHATGEVLTQVFGGAFSSRLNDALRVQKGLTYGASGGLSSRRLGGEFAMRTFTKTPRTAETVRALIDEVERMRAVPPDAQELTDAVRYLAGSFAGSLETPQAVADRLWTLRLHDLPADHWATYLGRITSVNAEHVAQAAADLMHPERLIVVVVGDAAAVEESLAEIAPVQRATVQD